MIDDFVYKNNNLFYEDDMPEGHLARFVQKLDIAAKKRRKLKLYGFYSVAATIILLIALDVVLTLKNTAYNSERFLLAWGSPEQRETENYYLSEIHNKTKILMQLNKIDPEVLKSDLKEIDASIKGISEDMKNNPGDERIVNAVMSVYQAKIDMLDNLIDNINN